MLTPPPIADHGSPLATLLQRYPGVGRAKGFRPVVTGLLNRGYEVHTVQGRWFLKHYLDQTPADTAFQHRVTERLAGQGLPVVAPCRDYDGKTTVSVRGRNFALYPWIEGRHRSGTGFVQADCLRLGALLAHIHRTLMRLLPPVQQPLLQPSADPRGSLAVADRLLAHIRGLSVRRDFDGLAEQRLPARQALLRRQAHRRPQDHEAPDTGYVHGDFHPLNVLYRADEPVAVLDWDRLGALPEAEEVVRAGLLFFTDSGSGVLDLAKVRSYVAGYRAVHDPGPAQLAAAVHRLWWERLNDFWMLERHYFTGSPHCGRKFLLRDTLVTWWTGAYGAVLESFTE